MNRMLKHGSGSRMQPTWPGHMFMSLPHVPQRMRRSTHPIRWSLIPPVCGTPRKYICTASMSTTAIDRISSADKMPNYTRWIFDNGVDRCNTYEGIIATLHTHTKRTAARQQFDIHLI